MLEPKTRWKISEQVDSALVEELVNELNLEPFLARLLVARGIKNTHEAVQFLQADQTSFYNPFQLLGMRQSVERIRLALKQGEKIRIYGDYDADGVSSTALMIYLLRQVEANFDYYIPHRANEGYGLNNQALDHAKKNGVSLMITVDNGISACTEIEYANQLGLDIIVTDHHEPPEVLPNAFAIINPKQPNCSYPFKQLAGVGVAFKLAHALLGDIPEGLLQLASIGTIADLMPLIDENRLIVKLGLERMRKNAMIGIKALSGIAGIEWKEMTAMNIGYTIAPRINASGRLESAKDAVQLLTATSEQEAEHLAFRLDQLNKERQRIVDEIKEEALHLIESSMESYIDSVIVVEQEQWNVGVIGIVASKVLDKYYRPTIILSIDPESGMAKGSARSISGFDMYRALAACSELLEHFGGHQAAAGMTLHKDNIPQFRKKLNQLAKQWLTEEDYTPITHVDMKCSIQELPMECIERINMLAPFGKGNPAPKFIFDQLRIHEMKTIGKDHQHLKLMASQSLNEVTYTIEAIAFGQGNLIQNVSPASRIDLLGEVSINEWNGFRKPQLLIQDIRVLERQVFDWRGAKRKELASRLQSSNRGEWEPAILLCSSDEETAIYADIKDSGCSLWTINLNEQIQPLNKKAEMIDFSEVKDLVLYSQPSQLSIIQSALQYSTSVQRIYAMFVSNDKQISSLPTRDSFKKMYSTLLEQKQWQAFDPRAIQNLSKKTGLSQEMIQFIVDVFEELDFIEKVGNSYTCVTSPQKRDLDSSHLYQQRLHRREVEQILIYTTTQELTEWILSQMEESK